MAVIGRTEITTSFGRAGGGTGTGTVTVTGVKLPSDTVMTSLLAALVAYGFIVDSTA